MCEWVVWVVWVVCGGGALAQNGSPFRKRTVPNASMGATGTSSRVLTLDSPHTLHGMHQDWPVHAHPTVPLRRSLERHNANMECNAVNAVQITHVLLQKMVRVLISSKGGCQLETSQSCGSAHRAAVQPQGPCAAQEEMTNTFQDLQG